MSYISFRQSAVNLQLSAVFPCLRVSVILRELSAYLLVKVRQGGDTVDSERDRLIAELERLDAMLYKNEQLFDLSEDETETEALIYEHRALMLRYDALLAKAKETDMGGNELIWQRSRRSASLR